MPIVAKPCAARPCRTNIRRFTRTRAAPRKSASSLNAHYNLPHNAVRFSESAVRMKAEKKMAVIARELNLSRQTVYDVLRGA
jgi:hypothetical protein